MTESNDHRMKLLTEAIDKVAYNIDLATQELSRRLYNLEKALEANREELKALKWRM